MLYFFIEINEDNKFRKSILALKNKNLSLVRLIVIPLGSFLKSDVYLKRAKFKLTELLGFVYWLILIISLNNIYLNNSFSVLEIGIHFLFYFSVSTLLLYLAIFDLIYMMVPVRPITRGLFFNVIIQLLIAGMIFAGFIYQDSSQNLANLSNIAGFFFLYLLIYLLIIITKEKGIGSGDADIMGLVGLSIGLQSSVVFLFLTIFIGAFIGVLYSIKIGKLKGVMIPMVPLIILGYSIALGFSSEIISAILLI